MIQQLYDYADQNGGRLKERTYFILDEFANIGKIPDFVNVYEDIEQRNYFSFYNYEYYLDVSRQSKIYPETISLEDGLRDSVKWYLEHSAEVNKKPNFEYINENFVES